MSHGFLAQVWNQVNPLMFFNGIPRESSQLLSEPNNGFFDQTNYLNGYKIHRNDRAEDRAGGVAIAVNSNIRQPVSRIFQ